MFIVVQFPFADVRRFLPVDAHHLGVPAWGIADDTKEFVRGHGPVRRRGRGGVDHWAGERLYCTTARALRFERWPRTFHLTSGAWVPLDCAFRRFFTDGVMSRVEVGVRSSAHRPHPTTGALPRPLTDEEWVRVCPEVLKLPVRVRTPDGALASSTLSAAGPLLARNYLAASTARPKGQPVTSQPWWVTTGRPLALVEYQRGTFRPPRYARAVRSLDMAGIQLAYETASKDIAGTWFFGLGPDSNPDLVRRARIHLFRLHAERECLKQVLRMIARRQLVVEDAPKPTPLGEYLDASAYQLSREWREGLPQGDILRAAYESDVLMAEGERADLLAVLTSVQAPLQRKVAQLTSAAVVFNVEKNFGTIGGIVNDKSQTISNSTITNSNLVIGDAITNVTNRVQASASSESVKEALLALTKAVEQLAPSLPKERQDEVARDLQTLAAEATSPNPRPKWYEVSAEGLVDAAKAVAGIGAPVIEAVKGLLSVLGPAAV